MSKLLNELKERRIWRVLVAYPSVTFVLLQAKDLLGGLNYPPSKWSVN